MAMTAKEKREQRAAAKQQRIKDLGGQEAATEATIQANAAAMQDPGSVAPASGPVATRQRSGATVTIGCKLGVAYYQLQLSKIEDKFEQNMQGGRMVKEATRFGPVVRLRGTAYPRGTPPKGFPAPPIIIAGAAMNPGIDKAWWDEWVKQHHLDPLVKNGLIFAYESPDHAEGFAREQTAVRSGLDPIDPDNLKKDPRVPRSTRGEVEDIAPGQRT